MGVCPMGVAKQLSTLKISWCLPGELAGGLQVDDIEAGIGRCLEVEAFWY
jgi:hypothetical protein